MTSGRELNVFRLHRRVLDDYAGFTHSFVDIADRRIAATVQQAIDDGLIPSSST